MTRDAEHTPTGYEDAASVVVNQAPAPSSLASGEVDPQIIARLQAEADAPGIADSCMVFGPDLRAVLKRLAALSPEAPALNTIGCAELEVGRAVYERIEKLIDATTGPEADELSYLAHLAASVEEVGGYDGPEAPAREGVFSAGQVWKDPHTDRWIADVEERGSAVVAAQAIGEDEDQAEARRDLILAALTPRHEAPASPTEREIDLLDAVMRAGGIVKTAAALPDKAAHLSVLTDALNRADAILTEGLNGAPVRHEAPAEGAGEALGAAENLHAAAMIYEDRALLDDAEIVLKHLRARSSAPEAREEALGNLLAVIHGDGGHRALEVGTKQAALEAEKIVAGLFAAPSADKLREDGK